jgi:hypothetical protein
MAPPTASPLETLPLIVLERICEYLAQRDDDSEKRRSLWAFSLTSRSCCAVAAAQRFCQIQLKVPAPDELKYDLRRWTEVLSTDGRHRYVRRLKVLRVMTEEERRIHSLERPNAPVGEQDEEGEDDEDEDEDKDDWIIQDYFDMHTFCRPSKFSMECQEGGIGDHPEAWQPLAHFISQLPALEDLVWACGSRMPRCILSAVHAKDCRLHMHCFRLSSLVQHRDRPQPIDLDDYALASSPSLFSIVVPVLDFETDGDVSYNEEAVMRMVAGTAPRLAHVWFLRTRAGDSLAHREAVRLGKPAWSGFFPRTAGADKLPVLGSIQSLVWTGYVSHTKIDNCSHYTDFAKLRRLTIPWNTKCGVVLAEMAMRGDFESLQTLGLSAIEDETHQMQEVLNRLLEDLNPLQRLDLSGLISDETFNIVLRRHGGTLRNLSVYPYRDDESRSPLVFFSEAVVQRLAEQCPNLEQVELPINRTRGDDRETGSYRALSRLPRLKRAFLRLRFSIGPDEEAGEETREGEYPVSTGHHGETIHFVYLREAFSNSAIDSPLALSIFKLISSGGSLRYLRLEISRKIGRNAPGYGDTLFLAILRWFNRAWVCKRDSRGRVTVRELDRKGTAKAGEEWQYLSEEPQYNGEEIYQEVFNDIWPQRTLEWWKDWKSLPLSYSSS